MNAILRMVVVRMCAMILMGLLHASALNFIGFEAKGLICTGKGGSKIIICQSKEVRFDTVCRYR